ncbi:uncharacterized protein BDV17DRAFT_78 [Aspergillus undulatus]|uniref:uncharacterized protein n=1 Tax=Aspergillus undulatus TaxID=1810928 RepID=UPI003CCDE089
MAADRTPSSDCTLPREKVFSIQIGTKLFRLSGASIASDAPSYFSRFFEEQMRQHPDGNNIRTLYIDRDPVTFEEIARHLQGYHCTPKDGSEYVKLFADSQFYSLPRLMSQLFEAQIIIQIGDRHFQITRDIFSGPGDSPNFFSLGFGAFFASPQEVFPGLDRRELLRPPAIVPPKVPNRSGDVFAQLVHFLRGYPVHIEDEAQRAELLRDCRYFHLRGLEQKLLPHHISFNPIRKCSEIIMRLEDIRRSGIHVEPREDSNGAGVGFAVTYARPFVDDTPRDLVLEIGDESTIIDLQTLRPTFLNSTKARVASLIQIILDKRDGVSSKLIPDSGRTGHPIFVSFGAETDLTLDGEHQAGSSNHLVLQSAFGTGSGSEAPQAKRRWVESGPSGSGPGSHSDSNGAGPGSGSATWVVKTGQWRIELGPQGNDDRIELAMFGVKLDVYTKQRERNRKRAFLGS